MVTEPQSIIPHERTRPMEPSSAVENMWTNVRGRASTCARHRSRDRSNVVPMRRPSADLLPLRLLLSIGVVLLAGPRCSRKPAPAPPVGSAAAGPPSDTPSAGPVALPPLAGEPGSTTRGEIVGVRYL